MAKLSRYSEPKKLYIFIQRFWDAMTLIEDREETRAFLKDLLTPTEIRMLSKRLQIADMLSKGYRYREIQNYVSVTKQTISNVNNKLQFGELGLVRMLEKLYKIDQSKKDQIEDKRNPFTPPPGIGRASLNLLAYGLVKGERRLKKLTSVKNKR